MKYYLPLIALCFAVASCGKPCEPSFTPFKPNFCFEMSDIVSMEGATRIPEDVEIYRLTKGDTSLDFHAWAGEEFIAWQTWEFPIDSTGPDYIERYFEGKFHIIECSLAEANEHRYFHVQDYHTNLYYDCSVSTKNGKKMLFVIFEFPDFRKKDSWPTD